MARNQDHLFDEWGIVHLTPIYEEPRSDKVLHEMGIVPKAELKRQFIFYDTQATCPFGVPADVYARIFFKHVLSERRERDTAHLAADRYPKNANVAMTTALAGLGPDETRVVLIADPAATSNRHELRATGAFGRLDLRIDNEALADNPKSSAMAALGLARAIANRATTLTI